jgi:hypothetical protein
MKMMKKLGKALRGGAVAVAPKKAAPMMANAVASATKKMTPALGGATTVAAKPAVGAALQKKSIGKVIGRGLMGRR